MVQSGVRRRVFVVPREKRVESQIHCADLDGERSQFRTDLGTVALIKVLTDADSSTVIDCFAGWPVSDGTGGIAVLPCDGATHEHIILSCVKRCTARESSRAGPSVFEKLASNGSTLLALERRTLCVYRSRRTVNAKRSPRSRLRVYAWHRVD